MKSMLRGPRLVIFIVLTLLVAVDLAGLVVLFTPLVRSGSSISEEFETLRRQVQSKIHVVIPPDQVQQRIDEARKQIDSFYKERFPSEASAISERLGALATENKVNLAQARYAMEDTDLPGLRQVKIEALLDGDYANQVKFINALEREKVFFIVDGVNLGESTGGNVRLQVALETYLRTAEQAQ